MAIARQRPRPRDVAVPFLSARREGRDANLIAALGVLYVLPVVALFLALRRLMIRGLQQSTNDL